MKKMTGSVIGLFVLGATTVTIFQNCSPKGFSAATSSKLSNNSMFSQISKSASSPTAANPIRYSVAVSESASSNASAASNTTYPVGTSSGPGDNGQRAPLEPL
ncbi:MAG: hypothetical protein H7061_14725, partial [Bdellovibrionaceae bacterium]|nr:hypothetical protein [Bdellovibrio sp.]